MLLQLRDVRFRGGARLWHRRMLSRRKRSALDRGQTDRCACHARAVSLSAGTFPHRGEITPMSTEAYNYSEFVLSPDEFTDFALHAPKATMRAPSFPLEDLATGETVEMSSVWKSEVTLIEFGSFT